MSMSGADLADVVHELLQQRGYGFMDTEDGGILVTFPDGDVRRFDAGNDCDAAALRHYVTATENQELVYKDAAGTRSAIAMAAIEGLGEYYGLLQGPDNATAREQVMAVALAKTAAMPLGLDEESRMALYVAMRDAVGAEADTMQAAQRDSADRQG